MKKKLLLLSALVITLNSDAQPPRDENRPKMPTSEERLKHVSEKMEAELKLTASQKQKLVAAYKAFFASMEKLPKKEGRPIPPPPPPPPADKEAVDKLAKTRDAQVKAVLTPAQYQKYTELEKKMRPPRPEGRPGPPPGDKKQ